MSYHPIEVIGLFPKAVCGKISTSMNGVRSMFLSCYFLALEQFIMKIARQQQQKKTNNKLAHFSLNTIYKRNELDQSIQPFCS
jgi:hypothetical protein